ncbi:hypothetical protein [Hoeflea sp.]|uniref:hypothetical protein n=1 Tax=Hoeflea sp. TaxID=1940281 RepID=UPI003A8E9EA9
MKMFHLFDAPLPFLPLLSHTLSLACDLTTMKQSGNHRWGSGSGSGAAEIVVGSTDGNHAGLAAIPGNRDRAVPGVCDESACGNSGNGDVVDNKIE